MSIYIASVAFGLVTASVLAIAAVGFTMQFGITDVINLAYGGVMMVSAFVAYVLNQHGVSIWIGVVVAGGAGAVLSVLLNRFLYAPFQRKGTEHIGMVIVSLAASIIIVNLILAVAGPNNVSYTMNNGPNIQSGSFQLTAAQIGIIVLSVVTMLAIHALLKFTRLGKAMRATACNRNLARNCGIRTDRVITLTWLITGILCGISGTVLGMDSGTFGPTSADLFLVVILAAAVLGGAGQPYGAMVGALVIGLVTEISAAILTPDYKDVVAFVILLVMMAVRPQGLFARFAAAR